MNKGRGFEIISDNQRDIDIIPSATIRLPRRGTKMSAGYDIFAPYDITLNPNEDVKVPTGIKSYMNEGEVLVIVPRSGLGSKYYVRIANTVGIIDADYFNNGNNEGHIWVKIRNESNEIVTIKGGTGFCQGIFIPYLLVDGDNFENGQQRNGGFGSTNK